METWRQKYKKEIFFCFFETGFKKEIKRNKIKLNLKYWQLINTKNVENKKNRFQSITCSDIKHSAFLRSAETQILSVIEIIPKYLVILFFLTNNEVKNHVSVFSILCIEILTPLQFPEVQG